MKILTSLLCCFFATTSFALTKVNLALDWYVNPDHAPILAAETQGFFAKNGLQVNLVEPSQSSTARNLVVAGDAMFGLDYEPEALLAMQKGMPIKMVGTLVSQPLSCIAVLASSGIQSLKDLKGHSLGYSGNALEKQVLDAELHNAGLKPGDVKLVPVHMDLSQALLSKNVTAVNGMMRNVEPVMLGMRGIKTKLFFPEDHGVPSYSELVFIAKTDVSSAVTKAFLKSIKEGVAYVKSHPAQSWQQAKKAYANDLAPSKTVANENQAIWLTTVPYFAKDPDHVSIEQARGYASFMLKKE